MKSEIKTSPLKLEADLEIDHNQLQQLFCALDEWHAYGRNVKQDPNFDNLLQLTEELQKQDLSILQNPDYKEEKIKFLHEYLYRLFHPDYTSHMLRLNDAIEMYVDIRVSHESLCMLGDSGKLEIGSKSYLKYLSIKAQISNATTDKAITI